ncbi:MAG: hypothetical protein Q9169_001236 [Polycauliona sp. 2 TL-2023]
MEPKEGGKDGEEKKEHLAEEESESQKEEREESDLDKDGNQQSAMSIVQRHVEVLDRRNSDGSNGGSESES